MALTWIGFATGSVGFLFVILFLTGLQSALFGPVKYAILPNLLSRAELLAGNAWVAVGTFISILAGSLTGTLVMGVPDAALWVPGILVISAGAGYLASHRIPAQVPAGAGLRLSFEPFSETARIVREGLSQPRLAWLMLAISLVLDDRGWLAHSVAAVRPGCAGRQRAGVGGRTCDFHRRRRARRPVVQPLARWHGTGDFGTNIRSGLRHRLRVAQPRSPG